MSININSLPYLCLRTIFDHLPACDQISMHEVCLLWQDLQSDVLKRRHLLTIVIASNQEPFKVEHFQFSTPNNDSVAQIQDSILVINNNYNKRIVDNICRVFPNITRLGVVHKGVPGEIQLTVRLLNHFGAKINTLRLWCQYEINFNFHFTVPVPEINHLIGCISGFRRLRLFSLECSNYIFSDPFDYIYFPLIGQLEQLNFSTFDGIYREEHILSPSMRQFVPGNQNLREISLSAPMSIEECLSYSQVVAGKFGQLKMSKYIELWQLDLIGARFTMLHTLEIIINDEDSWCKWTRHLALLPSLRCLTLELQLPLLCLGSNSKISPIPSVQKLIIHLSGSKAHTDLHQLQPEITFPNVGSVFVDNNFTAQCKACRYSNWNEAARKNLTECARQLCRPFKDCPELNSVKYHNVYAREADILEWTSDDL